MVRITSQMPSVERKRGDAIHERGGGVSLTKVAPACGDECGRRVLGQDAEHLFTVTCRRPLQSDVRGRLSRLVVACSNTVAAHHRRSKAPVNARHWSRPSA
jgi:hypothetical protein